MLSLKTEKVLNIQISVGPRLIATVIDEMGIECDPAWFKSVEENPELLRDYLRPNRSYL